MVGMRDVAKEAGVSLSTVSLVVNDTGYVSGDMRTKVEAAMRRLNYIPNELARNLYHNRTNTIGIIMPTIAHPFFSTLTSHLQREFAARDLKTLLCSTADTDKGEGEYAAMLQRHMMDGLVMAAHTEHPSDYWSSISRPIVAFDRTLGEGVPTVRSDHEQGGRLIADQLIRTSVRHVVLVGGPLSQFAKGTFPTIRYHLTVERMLAAAGIRCDYIEAGDVVDMAGHAAAARAIFERYVDVDAIVGSDMVAAVALQEAIRRGIDVPRELQVIAYDGTMVAETAGMRLTAVRQDFQAIAAAIAHHMDGRIAAEAEADTTTASGDGAVAGAISGKGAEECGRNAAAGEEDVIPVTWVVGETTR
jgi:LacI family sucrose operon transcriptional repressor